MVFNQRKTVTILFFMRGIINYVYSSIIALAIQGGVFVKVIHKLVRFALFKCQSVDMSVYLVQPPWCDIPPLAYHRELGENCHTQRLR